MSALATSNDDASGCMIKLNPRASKLLVLSGHSGSRIVSLGSVQAFQTTSRGFQCSAVQVNLWPKDPKKHRECNNM